MHLLILRHGKAFDQAPSGQRDFHRELEEKGREQARNAARILSASEMLPDIVLTSPLVRTRQTAETFAIEAGILDPLVCDWLACGMSPELAMSELSAYQEFGCVMIVGHEPDFSDLIERCLGTSAAGIEVRKGSLACLQIRPPSPRALLRFLLPFKLAKHLE